MADKALFNMSDKALLTKLHEVAMQRAKLDNNKSGQMYILLNSGISHSAEIDAFEKKNLSDEANKLGDKLPFFSNKDGLYEVGILVKGEELKDLGVDQFTASKPVEPEELYDQLSKVKKSEKGLKTAKANAYKHLTDYMSAFCGEKYAKSISESSLKQCAFETDDQTFKLKGYEIGDCSKKMKFANVLLYKIGYSVGAKK